MASFCEQLQARADASNSLLCIGLDPHTNELSEPTAAAAVLFCRRLIEATLPYAAAFKPNAAFFERFGAAGHEALVEVLALIPKDVPVILDAKRGDIGSTSEAYAVACLGDVGGDGGHVGGGASGGDCGGLGAHSVTVNPFMGSDSIEPFLRNPRKGAFLLCKTSNPGSNEIQTLRILDRNDDDGRGGGHSSDRGGGSGGTSNGSNGSNGSGGGCRLMVFEKVAELTHTKWSGNDNVGLVVGATDVAAIEAVRVQAPFTWLLCPGVGVQGGCLEEACRAGLFTVKGRKGGGTNGDGGAAAAAGGGGGDSQEDEAEKETMMMTGMLFPVSRGISKSPDPAAAAKAFRDRINACRTATTYPTYREGDGGVPPLKRAKQERDAGKDDGNKEGGSEEAEEAGGAGDDTAAMKGYQVGFIEFAMAQNVLKFGDFTLKSGRRSPYFFNAGLFSSGGAVASLARYYAKAIHAHRNSLIFDVIFGPAYKGIPLATAVGMALSYAPFEKGDVGIAYNRKEAKDHGEGGVLVGACMAGKRVLIVDDVITAGTAIREAVEMVTAAGGTVAGVVIALDRQEVVGGGGSASIETAPTAVAALEAPRGEEKGSGSAGMRGGLARESAVMSVKREVGCPVVSVVGLDSLSAYLSTQAASSSSASSSSDSSSLPLSSSSSLPSPSSSPPALAASRKAAVGGSGYPGGSAALAEAIAKYRSDYGVC